MMDPVLEANDRKSDLLLPVTVISTILMVAGVVGNVTVVVVIATRMSKKAINCFVLALASCDLFSCVVCVPMDILELRYPYLFTFPGLCQLLRFSRSISTISSGFLLIAIATERYRLICRYHKAHFSGRQATAICAGVLMLSLLLSWPALVLFGLKTVSLDLPGGRNGSECSISDAFQHSQYPVVYYSLLIILFFGTFISLCVLYAFIGMKIWKGGKLKSNRFSDVRSNSFSTLTRDKINNNSEVLTKVLEITDGCETLKRGTSLFSAKRKEYSRRRTTFIMAVMTSVFLIGCLPYIIISICRFLITDIDLHISDAAEIFFHFSLKSFMVSAAINPYIYGFCNERFKQELFNLPLIKGLKRQPERVDISDTSPQYSAGSTEEVEK